MSMNGISTAQDYLSLQEVDLRLPSGLTFRLRTPGLKFRFSNPAPESLDGKSDDEKALALANFYYGMLCEVCVEPRVSMEAKETEIHPDRIRLSDAQFIVRWAGGQIGDDGADLDAFREGKTGRTAAAGAGGGEIRPVAERTLDAETVPAAV